jgi:hypothetical protein
MIARGRLGPGGAVVPPPFSGQVTKVTGEGEQVSIAFIAETPAELAERLAAAAGAAQARLRTNNDAILSAGDTFAARQQKAYDAAVAQLRRELGLAGPDGAAEPSDADDPARALHETTDP